jgi:catechol 2,3-dioxygenase
MRLTRVRLLVGDFGRAYRFYRDVVGLRLSDHAGDVIAFMHAIHGSDHHAIAFAKSDAPGLHHTSWDVGSINAIGVGAMQMAGCGYTQGWGFGRHVIGSNFFHYVRDPWNSLAEYFCDIDQIPADGSWRPQDWGPEDSLYRWGPAVPADFAVNFEPAD